MGSNGGYVGYDATPTGDGTAPGVWGLRDVYLAQLRGTWPGKDPYWTSVATLLHFDGANGSTTFTDQKGKTYSAVGNAQLSTAQSKFGGSSLLLDGTGDCITTPDHADFAFGSGDFCIEMFVRPVSVSGFTILAIKRNTNSGFSPFVVANNNGSLNILLSSSGSSWDFNVTSAVVLSVNTWARVAVLRRSGMVYGIVDNAVVTTSPFSASLYSNSDKFCLGANGDGTVAYNGYMDAVRVTKGVARYMQPPVLPAVPFPGQ